MAINLSKILKELEKGNVDEQREVFNQIKSFVTENAQKEQQALEEKANDLQQFVDRNNGTSV